MSRKQLHPKDRAQVDEAALPLHQTSPHGIVDMLADALPACHLGLRRRKRVHRGITWKVHGHSVETLAARVAVLNPTTTREPRIWFN